MFGKDLSAFIADKMQRCNRTCQEASTLTVHKISSHITITPRETNRRDCKRWFPLGFVEADHSLTSSR